MNITNEQINKSMKLVEETAVILKVGKTKGKLVEVKIKKNKFKG